MERDESRHPLIGYIYQVFSKTLEKYFLPPFIYGPYTKISKNKVMVTIVAFFIDPRYRSIYPFFFNFVYCIDRNQKSKETHTCTLCCKFITYTKTVPNIPIEGKIFSVSESITVDSPSEETSIDLLYRLAQKAQEKIKIWINGEECLLCYIIDLVGGLNQKVSDLNQKFSDLNQKLGYIHYFVYLVNRVEYDGYTGKTFIGIKIGEILAFIPVNFSIYVANIGGKISYHTMLTLDGTHVYLMPTPKFRLYSPMYVESLFQENSAIEVLPLPVETGRSAFYSFSDTNLDALLEKASQTLIKFIDKLQEEIEKGRAINIYANPINLVYALMSGLVEIGKAFAIRREAKFNFSFAQDPNSLNFLGKVEVYTDPLIRIDLNAEIKNSVQAEIIITKLKTIEIRETYDICDEETLRATLKDVARKLRRL